ncbi:hypothetical protein MMC26_001698 [Xylographa opegraphella]|nr:hypothetical protein [Xylographa opegraphella]
MASVDATANTTPARVSQDTLLAVLWAGVAVSFCFFVFRIYVRMKVFHRVSVDDGFLLAAWIMSLGSASIWQAARKQLYLGVAVASGESVALPTDFFSEMQTFLRSLLAAYLIQFTTLWSVKLSFLFFFRGLGRNVKRQRIIWWTAMAFVLASLAVCIGTLDYLCLASSVTYIIEYCESTRTVDMEYLALRLSTSLDILTDVSIILVSTNILWNIKINLRKKLALVGICSLTVFVIVVAIIRVVISTKDDTLDLTWLILWGGVESSVGQSSIVVLSSDDPRRNGADCFFHTAIIVACLASFRALYTRSENSAGPSKRQVRNKPSGTYGQMHSGPSLHQRQISDTVPLHQRAMLSTVIMDEVFKPFDFSNSEAALYDEIPASNEVYVSQDLHAYPEESHVMGASS